MVFRLLCSRLGEAQATEAAHAVFLQAAIQHRADEAAPSGAERALLRVLRELLTARAARLDGDRPHALGFARDEYVHFETRERLEALPPDDRLALELRYVVGMSSVEAAAIMGLRPTTFSSLLRRAARLYRSTERSV